MSRIIKYKKINFIWTETGMEDIIYFDKNIVAYQKYNVFTILNITNGKMKKYKVDIYGEASFYTFKKLVINAVDGKSDIDEINEIIKKNVDDFNENNREEVRSW